MSVPMPLSSLFLLRPRVQQSQREGSRVMLAGTAELYTTSAGRWEPLQCGSRDIYGAQLDDFLAAVRGERSPRTSLASAITSLRIVDAARRSSLERTLVSVEAP